MRTVIEMLLTPSRARALLLVAALFSSTFALQAQAQDPYDAALAEGREAARQEHYERARAAFERARGVRPTQEVHFFLGRISSRMEQFENAYRYLSLALSGPDGGRPLSAEDRQGAQLLLMEVRARIGVFRLALRPADVQVTVNGQPVRLEPDGTLLLPRGDHRFVARHGGQVQERTVFVPQQREGELVFDLSAAAPATAPAGPSPVVSAAPAAATVATPAPAASAGTTADPVFLAAGGALLGVAGLAVIGALVGYGIREDAVNDWLTSVEGGGCMGGTNGPPPSETDPVCLNFREVWTSAEIAMGALFATAGAAAIAGVVLLIVAPQVPTGGQAFSCGAGPGELGLACGGSF